MVIDILKGLNWVDLLILALFIRIMYKAIQGGLVVEGFKLLSLAFALFISFHYYDFLARLLIKRVHLPESLPLVASLCFLVLWFLVVLIFRYIREAILLLFSVETKANWDRWAAAILGAGRFIVTASMLLFVFLASGTRYLEVKTAESFFGKRVVLIAPRIYQKMCSGFVSRLMPSEKERLSVRETMGKVSP